MRIIPLEIGDEGGNVENEILFLSTDLTRTVIGFMAVLTTCVKSRISNVTFPATSLLSEWGLMERN